VLGYVTVTDNGVARNFVVHTDGGILCSDLEDF
jgi:hypothetical protein